MSAEGRRILSFLANRPIQDNDITRNENGRPYFTGGGADFSISHSGAAAAVSFVTGGKLRTGCDIERARPGINILKIAEEFFSSPERNFIFSQGANRNSDKKFFMIWTLKECFLKLRGLSVFDMLKAPSFIRDEEQDQMSFTFDGEVSSPLSFYVYELQDPSGEIYLLSAAIEGNEELRPEIRLFSQSFLPARSIAEIKAALSPTETVRPKM